MTPGAKRHEVTRAQQQVSLPAQSNLLRLFLVLHIQNSRPRVLLLNAFLGLIDTSMQEKILSSWKEIASYLGRSPRTVQRWERELGLPVCRPSVKENSSVYAFVEQIDGWLKAIGAATTREVMELPESLAEMPKGQLLGLLQKAWAEEEILFAQLEEKRAVVRKLLAQLYTALEDKKKKRAIQGHEAP